MIPRPSQAIRQLVAWSKNIERGTIIIPPRETAAELMLMAVPRRRLNHLAINAAVFEGPGPLWAIDKTTPNINTKKRMWKVRASIAVAPPRTTRETNINFRPPVRSKIRPKKGWLTPLTKTPREAATEIVNRFQPNSSLIGTTNTPKLFRAPTATKPMNKVAAHTYQP